MIRVERRNNETNEQLLRRFRKRVMRSKVMSEVRRRRWFVSKSELARLKRKKAIRKQKRSQQRRSGQKRR